MRESKTGKLSVPLALSIFYPGTTLGQPASRPRTPVLHSRDPPSSGLFPNKADVVTELLCSPLSSLSHHWPYTRKGLIQPRMAQTQCVAGLKFSVCWYCRIKENLHHHHHLSLSSPIRLEKNGRWPDIFHHEYGWWNVLLPWLSGHSALLVYLYGHPSFYSIIHLLLLRHDASPAFQPLPPES